MVPEALAEHCRRCGSATTRQIPPGDTLPRATCPRCGAVAYDNPKIVVTCALYEGDRILFVQRAMTPYQGCWTLPSGFVESGETLGEAASREVGEETHLKVRPDRWALYGVLSLPDLDEIYIAVVAPLPGHDYAPSAEASDVRVITREEMAALDLGYPAPTVQLLVWLFEGIARGDLHEPGERLYEMRGRDPAAGDQVS